MADEDKTAAGPKATDMPAAETPANRVSADETLPRNVGPKSEWTASDDRGPLERAWEDESGAGDHPRSEGTHAAIPEKHGDPVQTPPHAATVTSVDPSVNETVSRGFARDGSGTTSANTPRSRSIWPVAAAVVLGAVIGAGSAYIDGRYLQSGSGQGAETASLAARVDALEKRPDAQAAVSEVRSSVTALADRVTALQKAPAPATRQAEEAPSAPPPDTSAVERKLETLKGDLEALKTQAKSADTKALVDKIASLEGALAGLKTATAAAQASAVNVEGQQKALAGRVMVPALAVVADSLVQQIALGAPYGAQVDALVALGVDPGKLAVLRDNAERGVPSAKTLAAKFEPVAEPTAATAQKPSPNAGFVDRLKTGALSMVSIRRADDTSGDDLPSRVARIKASLAHDDVPGAVATWEALPADAKAKSASWGALAKASADAMNAARALQRDAIVALGAKKS